MIFRYNHYQRSTYLSSANSISGKAYEIQSKVGNYFNLQSANAALTRENYELLNQINELKMNAGSTVLAASAVDSIAQKYLAATVINNSTNSRHNFITIDKGYKDGVKRDMGVISAKGVVGIVKDVSKHYASVISVINIDLKLSCKVKTKEYFGSLIWDGTDARRAFITDIPGHAEIDIGDRIVTSTFSAIFPSDISIGTVSEISPIPGSSFQKIDVDLSVDFSSLHNIYIVNIDHREERLELEQNNSSE